MIGEIERGKIYVHDLEHDIYWILQYLYFERDLLPVKKEKREGRKKEWKGIHIY